MGQLTITQVSILVLHDVLCVTVWIYVAVNYLYNKR
jgi:hypothetical protein